MVFPLGVSPLDFCNTLLAIKKGCYAYRHAFGKHNELGHDLEFLDGLLTHVKDDVERNPSICTRTDETKRLWCQVLEHCESVKKELQDLLYRFQAIASPRKRQHFIAKVKFSLKETAGLTDEVDRCIDKVSTLLDIAAVGTLQRIEPDIARLPAIEDLVAEIPELRRAVGELVDLHRKAETTSATASSDEEKNVIRSFCRRMRKQGVENRKVLQYKKRINAYIRRLELEEDARRNREELHSLWSGSERGGYGARCHSHSEGPPRDGFSCRPPTPEPAESILRPQPSSTKRPRYQAPNTPMLEGAKALESSTVRQQPWSRAAQKYTPAYARIQSGPKVQSRWDRGSSYGQCQTPYPYDRGHDKARRPASNSTPKHTFFGSSSSSLCDHDDDMEPSMPLLQYAATEKNDGSAATCWVQSHSAVHGQQARQMMVAPSRDLTIFEAGARAGNRAGSVRKASPPAYDPRLSKRQRIAQACTAMRYRAQNAQHQVDWHAVALSTSVAFLILTGTTKF